MSAPDLVTVRSSGGDYQVNPERVLNLAVSALLSEGHKTLAQELMSVSIPVLRAPLPSSDPEGGARGVQTSIATKQESCPESAPRTETEYWKSVAKELSDVLLTVRPLGGSELFKRFKDETYLADPAYFKAAIGRLRQDLLEANLAVAQLTKTPSADHDAGNLRSLAVQGSIATKQESCPESAPRTETAGAIYSALSSACIEHSALSVSGFNLFGDSKSIKAAQEWLHSHSQIGDLKTNLRHWRDECGKLHAQLTKTSSAGHDDGNLSGLAEPNHQPHAVSQGWQDIETAPRDGTRILVTGGGLQDEVEAAEYNARIGCWNTETYTLDDRDNEADGYSAPTHWMPLPAPPSPAKTGGAS